VYLGQLPEAPQKTLTPELPDLVRTVLRQYAGPLPRLACVTDKGQAQDDYYRRVLRKLPHPCQPGQRRHWEWVLDFFQVCGYVSKLRAALLGTGGQRWFGRLRPWLRERPPGAAAVLRSAMQHYKQSQLSRTASAEYWKAYR
jgi:hypothetical protein